MKDEGGRMKVDSGFVAFVGFEVGSASGARVC
jgi:hypothetical protein